MYKFVLILIVTFANAEYLNKKFCVGGELTLILSIHCLRTYVYISNVHNTDKDKVPYQTKISLFQIQTYFSKL